MDYLEIARRAKANFQKDRQAQPEPAKPIDEGRIVAVEICSSVLEAHIWLAFDKDFNPGDGQAVFYAHEIPILTGKTAEQLREIHKTKLAFGSGRVTQ
jgi:hypothetical protein